MVPVSWLSQRMPGFSQLSAMDSAKIRLELSHTQERAVGEPMVNSRANRQEQGSTKRGGSPGEQRRSGIENVAGIVGITAALGLRPR
jgi:hypothetical protein